MTVYRTTLTHWSTKTEETNQKYRQMKNKAYVSFAEGQAWLYNHCAASFESSDKDTIQAYEPATFVAELQKADSTLALDDLRIILTPPGTLCYCELMQAYRNVGHTELLLHFDEVQALMTSYSRFREYKRSWASSRRIRETLK